MKSTAITLACLASTAGGALIHMNLATSTRQNLSPFASKALEFVSAHPIVQKNDYCAWFGRGQANIEQTRDLIVQFSVFSNLFLLAQLNKVMSAPLRAACCAAALHRPLTPPTSHLDKVINAPTKEDMREGKEILTNELGVVFKPPSVKTSAVDAGAFDPSVVSCAGSVVGGVYNHRAAHFEWLCDVGSSVGLEFGDIGKRRHGSEATLHSGTGPPSIPPPFHFPPQQPAFLQW